MLLCANLSAVRPAAIITTFLPEVLRHLTEVHWSVLETALNNPSTSVDEALLLSRIAQRDRQAFSQLYDRYSGVLYSTIFRVLNNADESNDVLQDVFVQIWNRAGAYDRALGKPFTWAMTLTRNKAIDRLRTLKRRYSFMEELTLEMEAETHHRPFAGTELFSNDQSALVRAAVATLPLEQRQAIEMAFLGGLSQQEIAESLQQPLGTIKARIRRGMLRLRETLKGLL